MSFTIKFSLKKSEIFGICGMLISAAGAFVLLSDMQKLLFLIGAVFLICASILARHRLYIWLQSVVIIGTLSAFLPSTEVLKVFFPLAAGILYLFFNRDILLRDINEITGAFGVIILSSGFALSHPAIYLCGAIVIAAYSFCEFRKGIKIALLWLVLNLIFALSSLYALLKLINWIV